MSGIRARPVLEHFTILLRKKCEFPKITIILTLRIIQKKKGLRSLKTLFIRRQQVFYLRCKASERHRRHRTVASKTRPRAGHKIKKF